MSAHARFSSYVRRTTDRAVTSAYTNLTREDRPAFAELLDAVRKRSALRMCPVSVAALRNIARFSSGYLRPLTEWTGAVGTMYPVIESLAQHLLARYRVPRFLASVWYGDVDGWADAKRRWFIAHATGKRFRDLDLPVPMTRQMESLFLRSPDHLSVEAAMRRAELLSLGAKDDLVNAVLATRLGSELANGAFWRTVMQFFVRWSHQLDPDAVGPIVDFIQQVRHERVEVVTGDGVRFVDPPDPCFSIKGRSLASMQRLLEAWHKGLGARPASALSWSRSRLRPLTFEDPPADPDRPPVRWQIVELTSSAELQAEGKALRHCVASYARLCLWGHSQIWSLRCSAIQPTFRSVATIQVDSKMRVIVQARGLRNQAVSRRARDLMLFWARRENIGVRV
jgi:PcfJ-like protein